MSPAEQLRAAKALIDTPEKWTKRAAATDAAGGYANLDGPEASRFCAWGAMCRIDRNAHDAFEFLDEALEGKWGVYSFITFNDNYRTTHADVMALFDRAIELAEQPA